MDITEIRIFPSKIPDSKIKAFVSATFDAVFVVHGIKIISGFRGLFISMPGRKMENGEFKEIAHPITGPFLEKLQARILRAYEDELSRPENQV